MATGPREPDLPLDLERPKDGAPVRRPWFRARCPVVLPLPAVSFRAALSARISSARCAAADAAGLLGLSDRPDYLPANPSGGPEQRAAAALDKGSAAEVVDLLKRLGARRGATTLPVTRDNRILDRADRILTLEDGRIVSVQVRN